MKSTKIAILLPDLRGGGVESVRVELARSFIEHGLSVEFVVLKYKGELVDSLPMGSTVVDLDCDRIRHSLIAIYRYLRNEEPSVLLAAMWPLTGIACIAAKLSCWRGRLVVSEHTDLRDAKHLRPLERHILKYLGSLIYSRANVVVAVSTGVAASMEQVAGLNIESVRVISNPLLLEESSMLEPRDEQLFEWWNSGSIKVLSVGNLKPAKAFHTLIEALARKEAPTDAKLIIVGEGPLRTELEERILSLNLSDQVRLPGFRKPTAKFYEMAELFVLSSEWEGFGNVLVEALHHGLPIVSTNCRSGPAEILDNGRFGTLVDVGDSEGIARGISDALSSHHDGDARKRRSEDFTLKTISKKYLDAMCVRDTQ